jgi:hypothetical protein
VEVHHESKHVGRHEHASLVAPRRRLRWVFPMATYHLLIHPSVNRVYGRAAPALATAELRTVGQFLLPGTITGIDDELLGPAPALRITTATPLDERGLAVVGGIAGAYVLFAAAEPPDEPAAGVGVGVGDRWLTPLTTARIEQYPGDLLTTLKYPGKTNEQFTALLVNLALAAGRRGFDALRAGERVRLLDPVCGRGTTLNQALMLGLDVVGVETQGKDVEIYLGFIRQYLRDHLIKHRSDAVTLRAGPERKRGARRVTVTIVHPDGAGGRREQVLDLVEDDTANVRDHCKGSSVDLVVGDLPYGVQHAARGTAASGRDLLALLRGALPGWRGALRGGGALCLGFNTRVLDRVTLDDLLREHGLDVVEAVTDGRFVHRVDRTIDRDVALAVKPG